MGSEKRRFTNKYNIFVAEMMPKLCAIERQKPKENRKKPCELMKVIGERWQLMKHLETSFGEKINNNSDLYEMVCDEDKFKMEPSGVPEKECN